MLNSPLPRKKKRLRVAIIGGNKNATTSSPNATGNGIGIEKLRAYIRSYILDQQAARRSLNYIAKIEMLTGKLLWWMDKQNIEYFNADTMRGFQTYYQTSHESPEGRWEMGHLNARYYKNVSSGTAAEYHRHIHTLCRWLVAQGFVKRSPIEGVTRPVHRPSRNFRVFTKEECKNLLKAAVKTDYAERDLAIITLLLETGLRATELCTLRWCDIDMEQRKAVVMGKGEKTRTVYWFRDVQTILMQWATYAHYTDLDPSTYVFPSERAEHLNKDSLRKIVKRIALIAQIRDCHPHAFRHTFAVMYLLSGGQQMALKQLMGHEKLEMTDKYVRFAEVDIAEAARKHSPMEYIKKKK